MVHIICMNNYKFCNYHDQIAAEIPWIAPSYVISSFFEIRTFFLKHPVLDFYLPSSSQGMLLVPAAQSPATRPTAASAPQPAPNVAPQKSAPKKPVIAVVTPQVAETLLVAMLQVSDEAPDLGIRQESTAIHISRFVRSVMGVSNSATLPRSKDRLLN